MRRMQEQYDREEKEYIELAEIKEQVNLEPRNSFQL
jgi:hypothetical protein